MSILTNPSAAFSTSLIYITIGTLLEIWTVVAWIFYPPSSSWGQFLMVGFMASGAAVLVIGLFLGPIGRSARKAELPPDEVTPAATQAEQLAAANPPAVVSTGIPPAPVGNPMANAPREPVRPDGLAY